MVGAVKHCKNRAYLPIKLLEPGPWSSLQVTSVHSDLVGYHFPLTDELRIRQKFRLAGGILRGHDGNIWDFASRSLQKGSLLEVICYTGEPETRLEFVDEGGPNAFWCCWETAVYGYVCHCFYVRIECCPLTELNGECEKAKKRNGILEENAKDI